MKEAQKNGSPTFAILFPSKGMPSLSHDTTSNGCKCILTWPTMTRKKNLLQQVTSAFQEQLKVQSRNYCFWRAAEGTEISAHINLISHSLPNLHSPLFLYNKINFLHNQNNDYQRFHWRISVERNPQPLLFTTPALHN